MGLRIENGNDDIFYLYERSLLERRLRFRIRREVARVYYMHTRR